jgi:hypothetical protein
MVTNLSTNGIMQIGDTALPVRRMTISEPDTRVRFPVVILETCISKDWFNPATLNGWFGLPDRGDDVPSAGEWTYWDGARGGVAPNCKVHRLRIGASQGDECRCTIEAHGAGEIVHLGARPSAKMLAGEPALFRHISFGGSLSTVARNRATCGSFDLDLCNNLDPCPDLNGTKYPTEHNSVQLTAVMRLLLNAGALPVADNTPCMFTICPPGGNAVVIAAKGPVCIDRNTTVLQASRQLREYNYLLRSGTGPQDPPVAFS